MDIRGSFSFFFSLTAEDGERSEKAYMILGNRYLEASAILGFLPARMFLMTGCNNLFSYPNLSQNLIIKKLTDEFLDHNQELKTYACHREYWRGYTGQTDDTAGVGRPAQISADADNACAGKYGYRSAYAH